MPKAESSSEGWGEGQTILLRGCLTMHVHGRFLALTILFLAVAAPIRTGIAAIVVTDDIGNRVSLPGPATRVISLAPHLTELMFSIGAGAQIVGTVQSSDFPAAALEIPRVGDNASIDMERVVAMQPDLVLVWQSGNGSALVTRLRQLHLPVFVSEPRSLAQIENTVRSLGQLTGRDEAARAAADTFASRVSQLTSRAPARKPVRVFYQIWGQPIYTVGSRHLINEIIELCGGQNVFADLPVLAGPVDVEAVLAADPDLIVGSGFDETRPQWLDDWRHWPQLRAVQQERLRFIPPSLIQRHTLRVLEGAEMMCEIIKGSYKQQAISHK
jgi:iron complex transport system substrate-binding protein